MVKRNTYRIVYSVIPSTDFVTCEKIDEDLDETIGYSFRGDYFCLVKAKNSREALSKFWKAYDEAIISRKGHKYEEGLTTTDYFTDPAELLSMQQTNC